MGKKTNRFLCAMLALAMSSSVAVTASAETASAGVNGDTAVVEQAQNKLAFTKSGENGDNIVSGEWGTLTWSCNKDTGVLTITGNGPMIEGRTTYGGTTDLFPWEHLDFNTVIIGEGVTSVSHNAFSNYGLTSVSLPSTLELIDDYAFTNNDFETITLPDSVTTLGREAFYGCDNLKSINIPDSVTSIGDFAFRWCTSLESITIPDSVTYLGVCAFYECYDLNNVILSNSLKAIKDGTFSSCDIKSIVIPESVETIEGLAFDSCHSLKSITITNPNTEFIYKDPDYPDVTFVANSEYVTIYCYANSTAQAYAVEHHIPYAIIGNQDNIEFTDLTPDKTTAYVGDTIVFTPTVENNSSIDLDRCAFKYTITKGIVSYTEYGSFGGVCRWKPHKSGDYSIKCDINYNSKTLATKTIDYTVEDAPVEDVTIFYNGFDNPNIHYQVEGNVWTDLPGIKMQPSNEVKGYDYEYTIDLNGADYATVCFNDGNGHWDSQNGRNYRFNAGYYTYSNGVITEFDQTAFRVSLKPEHGEDTFPVNYNAFITTSVKNEEGVCKYKFTYTKDNDPTEILLKDYSESPFTMFEQSEPGVYTIKVYAQDSYSTVCNEKKITIRNPHLTGISFSKSYLSEDEYTQININTEGNVPGITYTAFIVGRDCGLWEPLLNKSTETSATWFTSTSGFYHLYVLAYLNGRTIERIDTPIYVHETNTNEITLLYNGFENPNIHYQVAGGSWTEVPGVAMESYENVDGYTYKYTIDLGNADYANVCFNDGNGHWDSRNGANYRFTKGAYTFSDGNISKID